MPRSAAAGEDQSSAEAYWWQTLQAQSMRGNGTDKGLQCLSEHMPVLAMMEVQAEAHCARGYAGQAVWVPVGLLDRTALYLRSLRSPTWPHTDLVAQGKYDAFEAAKAALHVSLNKSPALSAGVRRQEKRCKRLQAGI